MRFVVAFLISLLFLGCGAMVDVDYDKTQDFTQYRTYSFYPTIDSNLSQLDNNRIKTITDSLMAEKGFIKSSDPQLYINFYAYEELVHSRNTLGVGVGGTGRDVGISVSGGIPIGGNTIQQKLTVDFIDVKEDALVWQAIADGTMNERSTPTQREKYYLSVLQKILSKFPPKL